MTVRSESIPSLALSEIPIRDPKPAQREKRRASVELGKMVSKTEEAQLNRLENQVDNGGGGAWEYLCLVRKLKVRRSEKVLKYGMSILNDLSKRSSLGPEGEF